MVKKAYIITLEAVIAIVILYIFTTYALAKNQEQPKTILPQDIKLAQDTVFTQIQTDDTYRTCLLQKNNICLDALINSSLKRGLLYNFTICRELSCPVFILNENKNVYTKSIIISTNQTFYNTTLFTLYIWRKF